MYTKPSFTLAWRKGALVIQPDATLDRCESLMTGDVIGYGDFRLPPTRMSGKWGLNNNLDCSWNRRTGTTWTAPYPQDEEEMYVLCAALSHVIWKLACLNEPGPNILPTSLTHMRRAKGCGVWVNYSETATKVLRTWQAGDRSFGVITGAMRSAYRKVRLPEDAECVELSVGASIQSAPYPVLGCLGASLGVPPEMIDGEKAEGSCHNCDHPRQLLVLLAGIAAMSDIVEVQAAALS